MSENCWVWSITPLVPCPTTLGGWVLSPLSTDAPAYVGGGGYKEGEGREGEGREEGREEGGEGGRERGGREKGGKEKGGREEGGGWREERRERERRGSVGNKKCPYSSFKLVISLHAGSSG